VKDRLPDLRSLEGVAGVALVAVGLGLVLGLGWALVAAGAALLFSAWSSR